MVALPMVLDRCRRRRVCISKRAGVAEWLNLAIPDIDLDPIGKGDRMSDLAGFDAVLEITTTALRQLLLSSGLGFEPPFERTTDLPDGGVAHCVVTDVDVSLGLPANAVANLHFDRLSVTASPDFGDTIRHLDGTITVTLPLSLQPDPADARRRLLVLGTRSARVTARYQMPAADERQRSFLAGLALALAAELQSSTEQPAQTLPLIVDPALPSTLTPLVVRDVQLAVMAPAPPQRHSVALFLTVLAPVAGASPPDVANRGGLCAVPPGSDILVGVSGRVFHQLLFAPALAPALGAPTVADLPPTCGRADRIQLQDMNVFVTRIEDTLDAGAVMVHFHGEVPGGDVTDSFDVFGRLTFSTDGTRISPHWAPVSSSAGSSFSAGWWVASAFFTPLFLLLGLRAAAASVAGASLGSSIDPDLGSLAFDLPVPGAHLRDVTVTPERLALAASLTSPLTRWSPMTVTVTDATVGVDEAHDLGSGDYTAQGCPQGDYPWTAAAQEQQVSFHATPHFASYPARYEWSLNGFDAPQLVVADGSMRIRASTVHPAPPPGRTGPDDVVIEVARSTSDTRVATNDILTVRIGADQGNFPLNVRCTVTDDRGESSMTFHSTAVSTAQISMGGTWDQDLQDCVQTFQRRLHSRVPIEGSGIRIGSVLPDPSPGDRERILEAALGASVTNDKAGPGFLTNLFLTYGVELGLGSAPSLLTSGAGARRLTQGAVASVAKAFKQAASGELDPGKLNPGKLHVDPPTPD